MTKKYVLKEFMDLDYNDDLLTEEEKEGNRKGDHLILAGKIQMAEAKNGNNRVYPRDILEREIKNYEKLVRECRSLGELDHPDESVINLKNASHLITEVWWDGDNVMGKVKILDTPSGQIAKQLVKGGVQLGISSRGLGSTRQQGGVTMVEDDFQLICFDMVSDPSTPGAFMMTEAKEPTNIFTKADKINRTLNEILRRHK